MFMIPITSYNYSSWINGGYKPSYSWGYHLVEFYIIPEYHRVIEYRLESSYFIWSYTSFRHRKFRPTLYCSTPLLVTQLPRRGSKDAGHGGLVAIQVGLRYHAGAGFLCCRRTLMQKWVRFLLAEIRP